MGASAISSSKYEKVPPVRKPLKVFWLGARALLGNYGWLQGHFQGALVDCWDVARWLLGFSGWSSIGCCYVVARVFCVVVRMLLEDYGWLGCLQSALGSC